MARTKGSPNKATKAREEILSAGGKMPLDYMLQVLRDPKAKPEDKKWAAAAAAPYVHPRLSSVQAHVTGQVDLRTFLIEAK